MIRRPAGFKHFDLITQNDHALLAGELATQFGNTPFAPPIPFEQVIAAVRLHDFGWALHDSEPTLNPRNLPLHVFEVPPSISVRIWNASVDRAMQAGDYAGLLVSLHVFNLSALFLSHAFAARTDSPAEPLSRSDQFEMNKFQHRQVEIQDTLRARLGFCMETPRQLGLADPGTSAAEDQLRSNFRILTLLDRISLNLCCGKNLFPLIDDVHPAPGQPPLPLSLKMPDDTTCLITPWPFSSTQIELTIPAKRLNSNPWPSVGSFQAAYAESDQHEIKFVLRPA